MKKLKSNLFIIAMLTAFGLLIIGGCKEDNQNDPPSPELPPKTSFVMNFENFSNPTDTVGNRDIESHRHWGRSFVHVTIWNTLLTIGMAVPVAAFLESFNHQAVYHPDGGYWTWSYKFNAGNASHQAVLSARPINDTLLWVMQISRENGYQNFEWFQGKSAIHGGGGYWILNENPTKPNEILRIDWTHNDQGTGTMRYTNIKQGSPDYQGYIFYGSTTLDLNRFYNILSTNHNNLVEIEWNSNDKHGRIRDPHHFGDEFWYCWDVNLIDTDCP